MKRLIRRRLLLLPITLLGVTLVTFLAIHLIPGDPAETLAGGPLAPPEAVDAMRTRLGLDQPLLVQYGSYLSRLLHGDLGTSLFTSRSVTSEILQRLPTTISLTVAAVFIGVPIGVALGVLAAIRRGRGADHLSRTVVLLGLSVPSFWLALILVWLFSVKLAWLPFGGEVPAFSDLQRRTGIVLVDTLLAGDFGLFLQALRHLFLPAVTLAVIPVALTARYTREAFSDQLSAPYVRTARAFGVPERVIVWRYVSRNAMLPLVTLLGILLPALLSGAVLIEVVFSWPGLGTYLLSAIQRRDYSVVQAVSLLLAFLYVLSSLVVDISYGLLDPRIREST